MILSFTPIQFITLLILFALSYDGITSGIMFLKNKSRFVGNLFLLLGLFILTAFATVFSHIIDKPIIIGVVLLIIEAVSFTPMLIFIHHMKNKPKNTAEPVPNETDSLIENYYKQLNRIKNEVRESIISLLKENNLTSVNFLPYTGESYISNFLFYDCDKNGYGVALELDNLTFENGKVMLSMSENEAGYYGQRSLNELSVNECVYVLDMLSGVIEYSTEEGIPVLAENQEFDDI